VDSLSLMDHYLQLGGVLGTAEDPMLEGYTALGFLAARTTIAKMHLLVTGTTYRNPGLLAKIMSTLDVLSGGRAKLGIGAAWYEREHRALGVPSPPIAERFETLRLVAKYADVWNVPFNPDGGLPTLRRKLDVLREHCDRQGRDFSTIESRSCGLAPRLPRPTPWRRSSTPWRPSPNSASPTYI